MKNSIFSHSSHTDGTVDGSEIRPKITTWDGAKKNLVNNGILATGSSTGEFTGFLVAINSSESFLKVVCHFDKASDCGGRNCGSHGVCVHL